MPSFLVLSRFNQANGWQTQWRTYTIIVSISVWAFCSYLFIIFNFYFLFPCVYSFLLFYFISVWMLLLSFNLIFVRAKCSIWKWHCRDSIRNKTRSKAINKHINTTIKNYTYFIIQSGWPFFVSEKRRRKKKNAWWHTGNFTRNTFRSVY